MPRHMVYDYPLEADWLINWGLDNGLAGPTAIAAVLPDDDMKDFVKQAAVVKICRDSGPIGSSAHMLARIKMETYDCIAFASNDPDDRLLAKAMAEVVSILRLCPDGDQVDTSYLVSPVRLDVRALSCCSFLSTPYFLLPHSHHLPAWTVDCTPVFYNQCLFKNPLTTSSGHWRPSHIAVARTLAQLCLALRA